MEHAALALAEDVPRVASICAHFGEGYVCSEINRGHLPLSARRADAALTISVFTELAALAMVRSACALLLG